MLVENQTETAVASLDLENKVLSNFGVKKIIDNHEVKEDSGES